MSHDPTETNLICWYGAQLLEIIIGAQLLIMVLIIISAENKFLLLSIFGETEKGFFRIWWIETFIAIYFVMPSQE